MASRIEIDVHLAKRLIEAQFPHWSRLPLRAVEPGGWDNRSFRLGEEMVVRLPSAACYIPQVEKEQHWLPVLARGLPIPIPAPLALGRPALGYPWHWSVYSWIEGEAAARHRSSDISGLARSMATFLTALHQIDSRNGPAPGEHNCWRGGPLEVYDREARDAMDRLGSAIDAPKALGLWEAALGSRWRKAPVWVHGDISPENLLLQDGELSAVIDFGCCGVGDPACDLVLAWTFFGPVERAAFRAALPLDPDTWTRGRGWALWKALRSVATKQSSGAALDCFAPVAMAGNVTAAASLVPLEA